MPDVDIHNYAGGSTLPRSFTATGTYDPGAVGDPLPVVILEDADGTVIATGVTTRTGPGTWQSVFTLSSDYDDLSLLATLGGADSDEPHMNIRENPPVTINPVPNPNPVPPPSGGGGGTGLAAVVGAAAAAPATYDLSGTHAPNVAAIVVVAFSYKPNNRIDSILASVPALLDTPIPKQWKATITVTLPANRRLVMRAIALNGKGKILGAAANRGKKA